MIPGPKCSNDRWLSFLVPGKSIENYLDLVNDADILMRMRSFVTEHENGRHTSVSADFDAGLHDINRQAQYNSKQSPQEVGARWAGSVLGPTCVDTNFTKPIGKYRKYVWKETDGMMKRWKMASQMQCKSVVVFSTRATDSANFSTKGFSGHERCWHFAQLPRATWPARDSETSACRLQISRALTDSQVQKQREKDSAMTLA